MVCLVRSRPCGKILMLQSSLRMKSVCKVKVFKFRIFLSKVAMFLVILGMLKIIGVCIIVKITICALLVICKVVVSKLKMFKSSL